MITVEKVQERLQEEGKDTLANNEQLLKTGTVKKSNNAVIYWLLGLGAIGLGVYLFFFHKKKGVNSGTDTGISG
jgi:hypothetical protein